MYIIWMALISELLSHRCICNCVNCGFRTSNPREVSWRWEIKFICLLVEMKPLTTYVNFKIIIRYTSAVNKIELNKNVNYILFIKDFSVVAEAVVLEAASATIVNTIWVKHPTAANRLKVDCFSKLVYLQRWKMVRRGDE